MKKILLASLFCSMGICGFSAAFSDTFDIDKADLTSTGRNRYFVLEPGYQLVLEGQVKGKAVVLTITVLNETKVVDGVETRVVEERETANGQVVEVSRNYFAVSKRTGDVFYFGEDVDDYENGKVTGHGGAWLSGVNGARFGLMMPGTPVLGARYHQEIAPKVAMDRAEIVSLTATLKTPAGKYEKCLKTEESSALEPGKESKLYAPDIGLILDGKLKLTRFSSAAK
jgi:hypothetical protein